MVVARVLARTGVFEWVGDHSYAASANARDLGYVPGSAPRGADAAEAVPEFALAAGFTNWPAATLPVFVAMMFGATLGGNATLIGASANIVAVGICANEGERVTFRRFVRYGLPITLAQLAMGRSTCSTWAGLRPSLVKPTFSHPQRQGPTP